MCSPLMPGITDSPSSIRAVARAASAAGANFLAAGALFLKPCSLPTFLGFVREQFPGQLADYERRYASSAFVSSAYRERMGALVDQICREFKLGKRYMYEDDEERTVRRWWRCSRGCRLRRANRKRRNFPSRHSVHTHAEWNSQFWQGCKRNARSMPSERLLRDWGQLRVSAVTPALSSRMRKGSLVIAIFPSLFARRPSH